MIESTIKWLTCNKSPYEVTILDAPQPPLKLCSCPNSIAVSGTAWVIQNETELARLVARILLGQFTHVEKILKKLHPNAKTIDAQAAEEAKARTIAKDPNEPWHRDGLLFQAISWIAAHQAAEAKSSIFGLPHLIPAHKGFDGIEVELTAEQDLLCVVVFEDKATGDPRATIRDDVWPEIKALHEGQRQTELMQELTALLQRANAPDVDAIIEAVVWKQVRRFRVSVTGKDGHDQQESFEKLFKGFDEVTPGLDGAGRRAEVFCQSDIRKWMAAFAEKVRSAIDAEKIANSNDVVTNV